MYKCSATQTVCVPLWATYSQIDTVPQLRGQVASLFLSSKRNRLYWALRYDTSPLPLKQLRTAAPGAWHRQPCSHGVMVGAEGVPRFPVCSVVLLQSSAWLAACVTATKEKRKCRIRILLSCVPIHSRVRVVASGHDLGCHTLAVVRTMVAVQ
jgi:hypothetical protein